jgi:hypothetical protein
MVKYACGICSMLYLNEADAAKCEETPIKENFTPGTVFKFKGTAIPNWYFIIEKPTGEVAKESHYRIYSGIDMSANKDMYMAPMREAIEVESALKSGRLERLTTRQFSQLRSRLEEANQGRLIPGLTLHV